MKMQVHKGFTLIELMIVVAILGILAAIAIPTFQRYVKSTKVSEAHINLKSLGEGVVAYYQVDHFDSRGIPLPDLQFPTTSGLAGDNSEAKLPSTASPPAGTKVDTTSAWNVNPWLAARFNILKPHYYQYSMVSDNAVASDVFTASAYGDLDGDGIISTFKVIGNGSGRGEVNLTPVHVLDAENELE